MNSNVEKCLLEELRAIHQCGKLGVCSKILPEFFPPGAKVKKSLPVKMEPHKLHIDACTPLNECFSHLEILLGFFQPLQLLLSLHDSLLDFLLPGKQMFLEGRKQDYFLGCWKISKTKNKQASVWEIRCLPLRQPSVLKQERWCGSCAHPQRTQSKPAARPSGSRRRSACCALYTSSPAVGRWPRPAGAS